LQTFVRDSFRDGAVGPIALMPTDRERVVCVMRSVRLDFDDAYQYVAAEKHNLTLISFDADFDRSERGRKTPAQVLEEACF
jgi:predicted nucleic acid-binding protein